MIEQWKDIEGYEGLYQVSNLGNVKSLPKPKRYKWGTGLTEERILKPRAAMGGYVMVLLYKDQKAKAYHIHRLVAKAFIPNPNNYPEINHIDENNKNNATDNLEWCDHLYNMRYGTAIHRRAKSREKPVLQFDLQNNFIKRWSSIKEAQTTLNLSIGTIGRCCKNKQQTAGGFKWEYEKKGSNA